MNLESTDGAALRSSRASRAVIALLACFAAAGAGCATLGGRDPVQAYVVGVEPLEGAGLELRMLVKLRVQNPNETPIEYHGAYLAMDVQGQRFATGVTDAAGSIPGFSETVISVPVSISAFRLVRGAISVMDAERDGRIRYQLTGKLDGPLLKGVRFSSSGELTLPKDVYESPEPAR